MSVNYYSIEDIGGVKSVTFRGDFSKINGSSYRYKKYDEATVPVSVLIGWNAKHKEYIDAFKEIYKDSEHFIPKEDDAQKVIDSFFFNHHVSDNELPLEKVNYQTPCGNYYYLPNKAMQIA